MTLPQARVEAYDDDWKPYSISVKAETPAAASALVTSIKTSLRLPERIIDWEYVISLVNQTPIQPDLSSPDPSHSRQIPQS